MTEDNIINKFIEILPEQEINRKELMQDLLLAIDNFAKKTKNITSLSYEEKDILITSVIMYIFSDILASMEKAIGLPIKSTFDMHYERHKQRYQI